ncbi:formate/nitrite transporter family protein [Paenibacillus sp. KN14-4R]|uniref:formate/nitrite transporter family protein n=1 Tax=Paenibacillus sp. KN14-4R TaxID=3445773 RepID=UPI003F9FDE80
MSYYKPTQIAENTVETGLAKAKMSIPSMLALGFAAGAFISIGFLLAIRVSAGMPPELSGLTTFLSAAVFPVGLILVVIAGGELLTGNMMAVPLAWYARKISGFQVMKNWFWITLSNFLGALFVAYFFGHVLGLTETGVFLERTIDLAGHKIHDSFFQAFISGIGCNWLVALAVWLAYSSNDVVGKIAGIWFPTMAFVAIGFQHVVANMFLIPAAIFAGSYTWMDYLTNFVPVFLGNAVGGSIFVAMIYYVAYLRKGLAK